MPSVTLEQAYDNTVVEKKLLEMSGASSLRELIESGRLLNIDGQRFIPEGEKIPYNPDSKTYTDIEANVFEAMRKGGVLFFDNVNGNETPAPRLLDIPEPVSGKTKLNISDPINLDLMNTVISLGQKKQDDNFTVDAPEEMEKPGFFNRLWDSISTLFGGAGTDEMNAYRANQKAIKTANDNYSKLENIKSQVNKNALELRVNAAEDAPEKKQKSMQDIDKLFTIDKLGYSDPQADEVAEDYEIFTSFYNKMKDIASENYKMRVLITNLGAPQSSKNPAANHLHTIYCAYKNEWKKGRELDLDKMCKAAVYKPKSKEANALQDIVDCKKIDTKDFSKEIAPQNPSIFK